MYDDTHKQPGDERDKDDKEVIMTDAEKIAALEAEKAKLDSELQALKQKNQELADKVSAQEAAAQSAAEAKMVDEAIAAKKLLPGQKEAGLIVAKQGKEVFERFIAGNAIPDLTKQKAVDGKSEGSVTYADLLKDPKQMEQCKAETPELFAQLRKEYLGG
jgi:seryl-tRNA synthetase